MIQLLPKIKGMPDEFTQKVEKRKEVFQALSEEHSKIRCEFLTQKIKFDTLLDLSLSTDDKDLQASLIISKVLGVIARIEVYFCYFNLSHLS